jgi:hypothetical protein
LYPETPVGKALILVRTFGSVLPGKITQNAGCTMAIHADCTTPAKCIACKMLILKGFIYHQCWHKRCNYLRMLAIQVHTELMT